MVMVKQIDAALRVCMEPLALIDRSFCSLLWQLNRLKELVTLGEVSAPVTTAELVTTGFVKAESDDNFAGHENASQSFSKYFFR
jgi:hypothetical protein